GAEPPQEEVVCLLNVSGAHAHTEVTILFGDRDPAGPYQVIVPALRILRLSFSDLIDPEPIPRDTPYAAVIESDEPIVVQRGLPLSPVPQIQVVQ
ncbi:MAG TPA: sensory rhodopsin transducer, partial [Solirubrobacterales bacterium]